MARGPSQRWSLPREVGSLPTKALALNIARNNEYSEISKSRGCNLRSSRIPGGGPMSTEPQCTAGGKFTESGREKAGQKRAASFVHLERGSSDLRGVFHGRVWT